MAVDSIRLESFKQNLTYSENKELYGEINTPFSLINKMLDLMPESIFSNKDLRWLDPGCGCGYFSIVLFHRLFNGLATVIPCRSERKQYIIKNMMFMVEINEEHSNTLYRLFGKNANIIMDDYINYNFDSEFDIIIGNPPYNCNGLKKVPTNSSSNKKDDGKTLWVEFTKKSISILRKGGFLLCIIPSIWMKPDKAKMYNFLLQFNILKLHCLSNTETNHTFSNLAQTPTCYFLLQNTPTHKFINLYDNDLQKYVSFYLTPQIPLPVFGVSVVQKIIQYTHIYGNLHVIKTSMPSKHVQFSNIQTLTHRIPYVHTCCLNGLKPTLVVKYGNREDKYHKIPKIILAHKMYGFPYLDECGEYGISNRDNYVISGYTIKQLIIIRQFLSTKFALYLFESTRYRMKYLEKYVFELIPDITKINNFPTIINDDTICDFFNINPTERTSIDTLHRKKYDFFN